MKALAVLSGGLDSTVALAQSLQTKSPVTHAVFFDYGSKHTAREYIAACLVANHYNIPLTRVCLPFSSWGFKSNLLAGQGEIPEGHYEDETMRSTVVPFRNGIMLAIAAGMAESLELDGILIGSHFGDHAVYPDCRQSFNMPMREAIKAGTYRNITLVTPFALNAKWYIVTEGVRLGVPMELTWSCYKGDDKHCGVCGTCVERKEAFVLAAKNTCKEIIDPTEYAE